MPACTFFGHRECPSEIKTALTAVLTELIAEGVDCFYVGDSGGFDKTAFRVLLELKEVYPDIRINRVLAYFPKDRLYSEYSLLPEGIETVMPRFAINYRNNYMLSRADVVVAYKLYNTGGASKYVNKAERRGIRVINIANNYNTATE